MQEYGKEFELNNNVNNRCIVEVQELYLGVILILELYQYNHLP